MTQIFRGIILSLVFSFVCGCSTIYFDRGTQGSKDLDYSEWHHDGVLGLVEFSDPVNMYQRCGGKPWSSIRVERTFIQGLARNVTSALYDPLDVAYSCGR